MISNLPGDVHFCKDNHVEQDKAMAKNKNKKKTNKKPTNIRLVRTPAFPSDIQNPVIFFIES